MFFPLIFMNKIFIDMASKFVVIIQQPNDTYNGEGNEIEYFCC